MKIFTIEAKRKILSVSKKFNILYKNVEDGEVNQLYKLVDPLVSSIDPQFLKQNFLFLMYFAERLAQKCEQEEQSH